MHEWRIEAGTSNVAERRLSDLMMEFPVPCGDDGSFLALRVRSIEGPLLLHCSPETGVLLDGVVKFDGDGNQIATYDVGDGWWCVSEPTVCGKYTTVMVSSVAVDVGSWCEGFEGMETKVRECAKVCQSVRKCVCCVYVLTGCRRFAAANTPVVVCCSSQVVVLDLKR